MRLRSGVDADVVGDHRLTDEVDQGVYSEPPISMIKKKLGAESEFKRAVSASQPQH